METFTHILAFYFLAKFAGLKKKWAGMLAIAGIDLVLVLFGWVLPKFTGADLTPYWEAVHYFLHSFLVILIILPLQYFGRHLFISVTTAAYLHIFMDMVSHRGFPMPFYPISDQVLPVFLVGGLNTTWVLVSHVALTALLVVFESRSVMRYLKSRKGWFNGSRMSIFMWGPAILLFSAGYFRYAVQIEFGPAYIVITLLGALNMFILAGLFLREFEKDGPRGCCTWMNRGKCRK